MEAPAPLGSTPLNHRKEPRGQQRFAKAPRPARPVYHTHPIDGKERRVAEGSTKLSWESNENRLLLLGGE